MCACSDAIRSEAPWTPRSPAKRSTTENSPRGELRTRARQPTAEFYLSALSEAVRIKEILAAVDSSAVLTVSDMPAFTSAGGIIQFVLRENKVRFEVGSC
jgi:hypothetical protein